MKLVLLGRVCWWEMRGRFGSSSIVDVHPVECRFRCYYGDGIGRMLYYFRRVETDFLVVFERYRGTRITAIDVGANIGTLAIPLARLVDQSSTIVAFEPVPRTMRKLQENAELNGSHALIRFETRCVGERTGEVRFAVPHADTARSRRVRRGARVGEGRRVLVVPIVSLDEYATTAGLATIDFLKVDVEGFEYEVFRGARELLMSRRVRLILFEYSPEVYDVGGTRNSVALLEELGYEVRSDAPFPIEIKERGPKAPPNLWAWPRNARPDADRAPVPETP